MGVFDTRRWLFVSSFLLAAASAPAALAAPQVCGPNQVFLKNDLLPDVPSGALPIGLVGGLCEGEAMGAVFDVASIGSQVKLENAAFGFFNAAGANGIQAVVNLKVHDGITWSGGIPTLGPEIFDWGTVTGSSIAATTHAINTLDVSAQNIVVTSGKLVITWWMDFNPNGTCPQGYTSNFGTDATGNSVCTTPSQRNLIYIQGQGWRDARIASIPLPPFGNIPICPLYYNGSWIMRACVSNVSTTATYCTAKVNSFGCLPAMQWVGNPSATATSGFVVKGANVRNQKTGLLLYTNTGPASVPFQGGTLCINGPLKRTIGFSSGGNPPPFQDCSGVYQIDFNSFARGLLGGNPLPALNVPGTQIHAQYWGRDPGFPAPDNSTLTEGLQFDIGP